MHRTSNPRSGPTALALLARVFASKLHEDDLCDVLAYLNAMTEHRFTGVYRFEPGWVVSVALYDRENPRVKLGADVRMKESYCWLTGVGDTAYIIEDATRDPRLAGHAAREQVRAYVAVLLRDRRHMPWGTLCHFDFDPRAILPEVLTQLDTFRPLVEELVVRDGTAQWEPDAPSAVRDRVFVRQDQSGGFSPESPAETIE